MCFFFCVFREANCSLGGLLLCKSTPLYFVGGTIYFWHRSLAICFLFLQCEQAIIPRIPSVFPGRRRQWVGPVSSQCLVAGILTVARIFSGVVQATPSCRDLGSVNEP